MSDAPQSGSIVWIDLTVPDAEKVRDFYRDVIGWSSSDVTMGEYEDFCMHPFPGADPVAGVCHARGMNEGLPAQWLIYINVDDLDESIQAVNAGGGEVLAGPKGMAGQGRFCVIRDPAGAVCALFEPEGG